MKQNKLHFRTVLTSAAVALSFTALTAACDQEQPQTKTAQLTPVPAAKSEPGLIPPQGAKKSLDEILSFLPDPVAIIGTKKITKAEFLKKLGNVPPELLSQMPRNLLEQQFRMAIDTLVNEQLLLSAAEKAGIKPSAALATEEFEKKLKAIPPAQMEVLKKELAKQGKTMDDLKKEFTTNPEIINMSAINLWVEKNLKSKIKVTDAEVEKFYKDNKDKFKQPRTVTTSHILITATAEPGKAGTPKQEKDAKEKAESLLAQIRKGADFGAIAEKESKCGSAKAKGMLGEMAEGQLVKEYFDAAFALKDGEISNVVKSPFGYHIIKLHSKKEASILPLDAKLKTAIKEDLTAQALEKQLKSCIDGMKKDLNVVIPPFKSDAKADAKADAAKAAPKAEPKKADAAKAAPKAEAKKAK
ncbi:MAG: peptidylprolyl isomerase [Lentisphaeria bacterium]|nr:peptidylprolyl isomerase [Lentisphaeria bacterium]